MSEPAFQRMSAQEYLRTERDSPMKREFVDGFVYPLHAQAGASKAHVRICTNLTATLYEATDTAGCRLYQSDMKLMASAWRTFYYPDVMVCCGPENTEQEFESDACVLTEVLKIPLKCRKAEARAPAFSFAICSRLFAVSLSSVIRR